MTEDGIQEKYVVLREGESLWSKLRSLGYSVRELVRDREIFAYIAFRNSIWDFRKLTPRTYAVPARASAPAAVALVRSNPKQYGGAWQWSRGGDPWSLEPSRSRGPEPAHWPSAEQRRLLRSAFLPADEAREEWRQWRAEHSDFGNLDYGSFCLLPLVYARLREIGEVDPQEALLKGLYRRTWVRNQLLKRDLWSILDALGRARVDVVLLKGMASFRFYGEDAGVRPMGDADLLIPYADAPRAIQTVMAEGWTPVPVRSAEELKNHWGDLGHGWNFRRGDAEIDLHWRALHHDLSPFFDRHVSQHRETTLLAGREVAVPSATEHLIMSCVHGSFYSLSRVCNWAADGVQLLRRAGARVDWERLVEVAVGRRLVLPVRESLQFLDRVLGAPVPPEVHERLAATQVFDVEKVEHEALILNPVHRSPIQRAAINYMRDSRRVDGPELHWRVVLGAEALRPRPAPAAADAPRTLGGTAAGRRAIPRVMPAWRRVGPR